MDFLEGILYMLWRGIAIGVIISAPMGPVGILCVQRTLEKGRNTGFFTGVGAAISDLIYCLLTGFGLSFIEDFLKANQNLIQIIGSVVLIVFGLYLFRSNPARSLKKPDSRPPSKGRNVLSGFLFTFSNPLIIFLIIGLFARFNFSLPEITLVHYFVGYLFIFGGALMWWWVVSWFVDKVRNHFNLRSMWLINKITGGIIMIFGMVGIITAITGMASAARTEPLVIENTTSDTVIRMIPIDINGDFTLQFRAANRHNQPLHHYSYLDSSGNKNRVSHPSWGIVLSDKGARLLSYELAVTGDTSDDIMPVGMQVTTINNGIRSVSNIGEGLDFFTGPNSFRICRRDGIVAMFAGNRRYNEVSRVDIKDFRPDSIGFFVAPGGEIIVEHLSVESRDALKAVPDALSPYADRVVRDSLYRRSLDSIEGEWQVFDLMLDDGLLRSGGEYRLAAVRNGKGYDFIYLDGAQINPDFWKPGMMKCRLDETPFRGIYDVRWYDSGGRALRGVIKAQLDGDILGFQFAGHGSSTLRLRKLPRSVSRSFE